MFNAPGDTITFTVARGNDCYLYAANVALGTAKRVTRESHGCETDPAYSPDGLSLAYISAPKAGQHGALVLARADGTAPRTLVTNQDDNLKPAFVPRSKTLLFLRSGAFEHYSPVAGDRRHKYDLFSVDTSSARVLAPTRRKFYELGQVSVSADGTQLIFSVDTYPEGDRFLLAPRSNPDAPSLALQPVVPNSPKPSPLVYEPSWLPDGRSLIFEAASEPARGSDFNYNVYRLNLNSGSIDKLTELVGVVEGLSVSNDGKRAVILQQGIYSILDSRHTQARSLIHSLLQLGRVVRRGANSSWMQ